jgi:transposase InsO family protein
VRRVSLDEDGGGEAVLRDHIARLERRVTMLTAFLRLVLALLRVSGFRLDRARVPDAANRLRLYPAKPKVGVRTAAPNETWHIDVTIIRLLDGTKAYVHAVIDNFSRKILAWTVAGRLAPMNTHAVLTTAASHLAASAKADVTPDEIYLGRGAHVPDELAIAHREARKRRVVLNRAVACVACPRAAPAPSERLAA